MAIKLLIFDLDGTLVDSKLDLAKAVNATRVYFRLQPMEADLIYSYVGNGAPVLMRKAMGPDYSEEDIQKALEYFLAYYRAHMLDHTTLYPGVRESLERLAAVGFRMAVLTNKPVRISSDILAGLGVGQHFFRVYGGNSLEQKKPDPMGVELLVVEAGVSRQETMIVGDSAVDVLTARNAGVTVCGVTYGFQPESLAQEVPDILVDRMEDLVELVLAERAAKGDQQS